MGRGQWQLRVWRAGQDGLYLLWLSVFRELYQGHIQHRECRRAVEHSEVVYRGVRGMRNLVGFLGLRSLYCLFRCGGRRSGPSRCVLYPPVQLRYGMRARRGYFQCR